MPYAISDNGLALIREYEGFRDTPAQMPNGAWVVGYGHVRAEAGDDVCEAAAAELLTQDIAAVEAAVNEAVTAEISQSQFDALVSFAFSVGAEAFAKSDVLRRTNTGEAIAAACAMDAWRKSDASGELEIIDALIRRRAAEKALYLKDGAYTAAPSALVRAKIDHAVAILGAPLKYAAPPAPKARAKQVVVAAVVEAEPVVEIIAPVAFEEVVQAEVQAKPSDAEIITAVLRSEPQTEALLLTQVASEDDIIAEEEIVTAHAKPVARSARTARISFAKPADAISLGALSLFGVGLVGIGGWTMFAGSADAVDIMAGAALAIPGIAAITLAAFGMSRRPATQRA
jgi:GH24 family phage-related lysozyme (muramidase)